MLIFLVSGASEFMFAELRSDVTELHHVMLYEMSQNTSLRRGCFSYEMQLGPDA